MQWSDAARRDVESAPLDLVSWTRARHSPRPDRRRHGAAALRDGTSGGTATSVSDSGEGESSSKNLTKGFVPLHSHLFANGRKRMSSWLAIVSRMPEPLRLADLDPILITTEVVRVVYERAFRDALRVGLVARVAEPGDDESAAFGVALRSSEAFRTALVLAEWATSGRGEGVDIPSSSGRCAPIWMGST
jgi:hypothetical protein